MGMFSDLDKISKADQKKSQSPVKQAESTTGEQESTKKQTDRDSVATPRGTQQSQTGKDATPDVRPYARTPVRIKRTITRNPFEIFQDQLEALRKFSLEEKERGERGSMSQMVREAIDSYISKRNRTE